MQIRLASAKRIVACSSEAEAKAWPFDKDARERKLFQAENDSEGLVSLKRGTAMFGEWKKMLIGVALASALTTTAAMAQYTLETEVSPVDSGTVGLYPMGTEFDEGVLVTLTATPAEGYEFVGWQGDIAASESTMTIVMSADTRLTAVFQETAAETGYTLTAYIDPSGAGTLVRDPAELTYEDGDVVTVTAYAAEGFLFTGWSGDVPEGADRSNPELVLTITDDMAVEANFAAASTIAGETGIFPCGAAGTVSLGFLFSMLLMMKFGSSRR